MDLKKQQKRYGLYVPMLIFPAINYFVAFIILPACIVFGSGEMFVLAVLGLWLVLATCCWQKSLSVGRIFLGVPLMWALAFIYIPDGMYGIDDGGALDWTPKELDAFLVCTAVALFQVVVLLIIRALQLIKRSAGRKHEETAGKEQRKG